MTKVVYKRCSLTLDTETIRKSVSSFVRYLVGQAYEEATAAKRNEGRIGGMRLPKAPNGM
jgi:hypothetical protein